MTKVPNALGATVAPAKVTLFLLDPEHVDNKGRAQFLFGLGFDVSKWDRLRDALLTHLQANDVERIRESEHGTVYRVVCSMPSPDGTNPCVRTIWVVEPSGGPKFVTFFPGTKPKSS